MEARTALLLFGLAFAAQASGAVISSNISTWLPPNTTLQLEHQRSRLWDRNLLDDSVAVLKLRRLARVLARLQQGLAITVVTIGSSLTQDMGGYFVPDSNMIHLAKRLNISNPVEQFISMRGAGEGWGRNFMQMVNNTWPHANHTLLNYGRAACGLSCFSSLPCLTDNIPKTTDLIIMESVFMDSNGGNLEQLLTRLYDVLGWQQSTMPAHILIKHPTVVDWPRNNVSDICIRDGLQCEKQCAMDGPTPFTHLLDGLHYPGNVPGSHLGSVESEFFTVASYYHIPAIAPRWFFVAALQAGVHTRHNLTVCQFLSKFMGDPLHIRGGLGYQSWSEMLFNLLYLTQKLVPKGELPDQPDIPATPIYRREHLTLSACPAYHGVGSLNGAWDMNSTDKKWAFIEMDSGKAGSSATVILGPPGPNSTLKSSDGSSSSGNSIDGHHNNTSSFKKRKPGWVSTTPGAVLQFIFNSQVQNFFNVIGVLQYLSSYEHMGTASVECVENCKCEPSEFDGYRPEHRVSVPALHEFNVTAHPRCMLRVTVNNHTRSGEHKVKLLSIWAKGP